MSAPPTRRRARPDPARLVAYDLLRAVDERAAYANLVLPGLLRSRGITGRDAAFATELGYGALRWQGSLDVVLAACVDRPLEAVDPPVRDVLRLGAYQLLHTRVPAHAAVSATVELARATLGSARAGFVNAVLRRAAAQTWPQWVEALAPADDPTARRALAHGYPSWIVTAIGDAVGGGPAEADAALAPDRPEVHLAARPGRISRDELLTQTAPAGQPGPWSPYAVRLNAGDPGGVPAVRDGRASVQDEGSQLAALALLRAPMDGLDSRWLDLCAGPGGKAALLAGVADERGARLLAVDRAAHRAGLTHRTLTGTRALTVVADGTRAAWRPDSFDRVLLDAPCSGIGALRRRPDARWRRQPADLPALTRLQHDLLRAALSVVRPGGVVAYVVCSPHRVETALPVAAVLRERPDVGQLDARALLPGVPYLGAGPHVQLWPHRHGTDAMFITVLRRRAHEHS